MWNLAAEDEVRKTETHERVTQSKQNAKARALAEERARMDEELRKKERKERQKLIADIEQMEREKDQWEREKRGIEAERRQWAELKRNGGPQDVLRDIDQKLQDQATHREKLRNVETLIQEEREKLTATTHKIEQMSKEFLTVKAKQGEELKDISAQRREVDEKHQRLSAQHSTLQDTKVKYSEKIQAVRRRRQAEDRFNHLEDLNRKERAGYDANHSTIGGDVQKLEQEQSELQRARERHNRNRTADQEKTKLLLKKLEEQKQDLDDQRKRMNADLAEELARTEATRLETHRKSESALNTQIQAAEADLKEMAERHSAEEQKLRTRLEERKRKKRDSIQYFDAEVTKLRRQLEQRTSSHEATQRSKANEIESLKSKIANVKAQKDEVYNGEDVGAQLIEETEQFTVQKSQLEEAREQLALEQEAMDQERFQLEEQRNLIAFERKSLKETEQQVKVQVLNQDVSRADAKNILQTRDKLVEETQRINREWMGVDRVKRQMQELHREFAQELQTEIHVLENAREEVVRDTPAALYGDFHSGDLLSSWPESPD